MVNIKFKFSGWIKGAIIGFLVIFIYFSVQAVLTYFLDTSGLPMRFWNFNLSDALIGSLLFGVPIGAVLGWMLDKIK